MFLSKHINAHRWLSFCQLKCRGKWHVWNQGTVSAECQAAASIDAFGCTAYLNLEPADVEGGVLSVKALSEAGVQRVVIGMLHPMPHLRNGAVKATPSSRLPF